MNINKAQVGYLCVAIFSVMCFGGFSSATAKTAKCKRGHKAKVLKKGYIRQATFRKSKPGKSCVTFDGVKKKNRKTVCLPSKSVRCTGSKKPIFKKGKTVQVRKNKKNMRAKIKSYKRGKYCVTFDPKADLKDECVRVGRVRIKKKARKRPPTVGALKPISKPNNKPSVGIVRPSKDRLYRPNKQPAGSIGSVVTPTPPPPASPAPPASSSNSGANDEDPKRCYKMRTGTERSNCMISLMSPGIQPKVKAIVKELRDAGWQAVVHESRRDRAQQEKKCRDKRSKTMCSKHMCDNAADIIDKRYAWNISTSHDFWTALGKATKRQGLEWGGDWKSFKDVAHIQTGKCTLSQLRKYGLTSCDCPE